jgi:hypothetical protein
MLCPMSGIKETKKMSLFRYIKVRILLLSAEVITKFMEKYLLKRKEC